MSKELSPVMDAASQHEFSRVAIDSIFHRYAGSNHPDLRRIIDFYPKAHKYIDKVEQQCPLLAQSTESELRRTIGNIPTNDQMDMVRRLVAFGQEEKMMGPTMARIIKRGLNYHSGQAASWDMLTSLSQHGYLPEGFMKGFVDTVKHDYAERTTERWDRASTIGMRIGLGTALVDVELGTTILVVSGAIKLSENKRMDFWNKIFGVDPNMAHALALGAGYSPIIARDPYVVTPEDYKESGLEYKYNAEGAQNAYSIVQLLHHQGMGLAQITRRVRREDPPFDRLRRDVEIESAEYFDGDRYAAHSLWRANKEMYEIQSAYQRVQMQEQARYMIGNY